jgi:hypothetical protein
MHLLRGAYWVQGAFKPTTGEATMVITGRRDSKSHILLLEQMAEAFPSDRWPVIVDGSPLRIICLRITAGKRRWHCWRGQ